MPAARCASSPSVNPTPDRPARHAFAQRGDGARELVALDHTRLPAPLDEEVQVGSTDAAERDGDPHLVGREGAIPEPVDAEVLLPVTNGCKHGARCPAVS